MTPKQPPKMATWILKQFGSGSHIEELLGDLAEQYARTGNVFCYWRQTLKAVPITFMREVRANKWNTASGLVAGWVLWILGGMLVFPWALRLTVPQISFHFMPSNPLSAVGFMMQPAVAYPAHSPQGFSAVLAFAFAALMPLVVGLVSGGWIGHFQISAHANPLMLGLSRAQRDSQTSVILLFAGTVLMMNLLPFVLLLRPGIPYLVALLATNAAASVLGILLGAGLLRSREAR